MGYGGRPARLLNAAGSHLIDEKGVDLMTTVIRAGSLIDGTGGSVRRNVDLVVETDRIQAVRDAGPVESYPDRVTLLDAQHLTVLPGLIDAHVHICSMPDPSPFESFWNFFFRSISRIRIRI